MFKIAEIAVDARVPGLRFACDLGECKGACCTLKGGRGAPVTDAEVDEIFAAFPVVKKYLPREHRDWIETRGLVEGAPGVYATQCIDEHACVFVYYEEGVAKCSFERAFLKNEIKWRKPLSCHLFPLRAGNGTDPELRFEYLHECEPAHDRGSREGIQLFTFLKDVLVRAYGAGWYQQFETECKERATVFPRGD